MASRHDSGPSHKIPYLRYTWSTQWARYGGDYLFWFCFSCLSCISQRTRLWYNILPKPPSTTNFIRYELIARTPAGRVLMHSDFLSVKSYEIMFRTFWTIWIFSWSEPVLWIPWSLKVLYEHGWYIGQTCKHLGKPHDIDDVKGARLWTSGDRESFNIDRK